MVIYTADDMVAGDAALLHAVDRPATVGRETWDASDPESSVAHFCQFIAYYTQQSTNPMHTALACEKQAEAVQITDQDLTPETIRLLLDTMLNAIDHLEKKWLDEQIQREEAHLHSPFQANPPSDRNTPFSPAFKPSSKNARSLKQWFSRHVP